jgi:fumarate hydratase class II
VADVRTERDSMGEMTVPAAAYYGAQTARAVENFPISGLRFSGRFVSALGLVKAAAARVNAELGLLEPERAGVIIAAAEEVVAGRFDAEFVVDVFQTGSGTSTNMNANEVIAHRARELQADGQREAFAIHPNDHVNMGQSTNDVFPTALHIAALRGVVEDLLPALDELERAFAGKALEFAEVVTAGRTHLQDAVPVTLGQEFSGYAAVVRQGIARLESARPRLAELAIGGTALGTGLNAHPRFTELIVADLSRVTGIGFVRAGNAFEAMQNRDAAVEMSGVLRTIAVGLFKIANDLRLLASGPRTGFYQIELPATQPGSSIMPGKVNPVIPEAVNMVAAHVIGNDAAIVVAGLNGNLDLNVMMPVIAYNLLQSIDVMAHAAAVFARRCVTGIRANVERCRDYGERTASLVTAIAPVVGYDKAAELFKIALAQDKPIRQVLLDEAVLAPERVDEILDLLRLTQGGRA